jgi:hypothetical protein
MLILPICTNTNSSNDVKIIFEQTSRQLIYSKMFARKGTCSLHKTKIFPRKGTRSLHKTKHFSPEKSFFCNQERRGILFPDARKTHILALEFSNFSGGGPLTPTPSFAPSALANGGCAPRRVCPFSVVAPLVPEILDPPLNLLKYPS